MQLKPHRFWKACPVVAAGLAACWTSGAHLSWPIGAAAATARVSSLLLSRAKFLTKTTGWSEFSITTAEYHWISPDEVLYFRNGTDGTDIERLNVRTHVRSPMTGLTRAFNEQRAYIAGVSVSPDYRRLLWASERDKKPTYVTALLDGTRRTEWTRKKVGRHSVLDPYAWSTATWTSGGKEVAECWLEPGAAGPADPFAHIVLRGVDGNSAPRTLAHFRWRKTMFAPMPDDLDSATLFAEDHSIQLQNRATDDVVRYIVKLGAGKPSVSHQTIHLPKYANFANLILSPKADRIAWELGSPYDPTSRGMSDSHGELRPQRVPLGIWISRPDGSGLHELGHLPIDRKNAMTQHQEFGQIKWTPDGRSLSFIYQRKLYRIPVD